MARPDNSADYHAIADPYCYPGSSVLKNVPDIRDQAALAAFEAVSTAQRADEPLPSGRLSVSHYRAIHRHLFQDVYPWAGRFRTVRIAKEGSAFCYPENIDREMRKLFAQLKRARYFAGWSRERFVAAAVHFLATLNAIHPFREGNGRAQMTFFTLLADGAGYPLNFDRLMPERFLAAMVASFSGDEGPLAKEIWRLIE
jgi:cell filamentation protein